jgi:hypothetical protein
MKTGGQPELTMQLGKSKLQAKGPEAINAVKWPLRFFIFALGVVVLSLLWFAYGGSAKLLLAKIL